jgi:hypothetical protein
MSRPWSLWLQNFARCGINHSIYCHDWLYFHICV